MAQNPQLSQVTSNYKHSESTNYKPTDQTTCKPPETSYKQTEPDQNFRSNMEANLQADQSGLQQLAHRLTQNPYYAKVQSPNSKAAQNLIE